MIHLKDLGTFESVPDLVTDIINGNITALESALKNGLVNIVSIHLYN